MATGDAAVAAGYPLVASTDDVRDGWDEFNRDRDLIAQKTAAMTKSLGVLGTGTSQVQADLEYLNGQVTLAQTAAAAAVAAAAAATAAVGGKVNRSGDTMSGDLWIPGSSAATSGWTAAYINSDGRICRGASSLRYKNFVSTAGAFGDIMQPLKRFQMKGGDRRWTYGHIAEELAENPDTEQFVMYDLDGRPDSVDYIPLLLAKVEQLASRVLMLEAERASS